MGRDVISKPCLTPRTPFMFVTSAHDTGDAQRIFDDIEGQFHLTPESLVDLTQAFLDEVRRGLGSYGHPMAMMCVLSYYLCILRRVSCSDRRL